MASTVRVLVVIDALGEGGTERSLADLLPELTDRGVEFCVAILRSRGAEGVEQSLRDEGFDIRLLPSGRGRYGAFRALAKAMQPDVVHSMLFDSNMVVRLAGVGLGVPVLTSLVNMSYSPERFASPDTAATKLRIVQGLDAVTGRLRVAHFHAVSESVRRDAVAHLRVPEHRLSVIPRGRRDPRAGLDADAGRSVREELGLDPADVIVTNVARHEPQKDQLTLLRAIAPVLDAHPGVHLLIAGREGTASPVLRAELAGSPQRDRVRLLGHRGDVAAVLAASDLFVLTSRYEGMPGAAIEAMAAGVPVVASDIGPVREVVEVDRSALVAPAGDAVGFGAAIDRLVCDPDLRATMGRRGRQIYEQRFTLQASADAMADLYRRMSR